MWSFCKRYRWGILAAVVSSLFGVASSVLFKAEDDRSCKEASNADIINDEEITD